MKNSVNVLNIPLYYISFKKNIKLEEYLKSQGFKNINHFKAINGKRFNPKKLLNDKTITIRSYNDIINNREQHSGLSSMGAIGCTLSHSLLWEKCVKDNIKYMTIVEDDVIFPNGITDDDIKKISETITKDAGVFIGTNHLYRNKITDIMGLQFYVISNSACKKLLPNCFPIDVQTDHYIANLDTIGEIYVEGYNISKQQSHTSSIQDMCIKCFLPKSNIFYIIFVVILFFIIIYTVYISIKYFKNK